jgi:hypothetical protein
VFSGSSRLPASTRTGTNWAKSPPCLAARVFCLQALQWVFAMAVVVLFCCVCCHAVGCQGQQRAHKNRMAVAAMLLHCLNSWGRVTVWMPANKQCSYQLLQKPISDRGLQILML